MDPLFLIAIPVGALAGFLAGLFGIGGGLILVSALVFLLPAIGVPGVHVMHVALATSLSAIVLTALSSSNAHRKRGSVMWPTVWRLLPGLVAGGVLGAQCAGMLADSVLRIGVACFCFLASWELWRGPPARPAESPSIVPTSAILWPAGLVIGVVSALVGIGGGSLTVPLLIRLGATPVRAVGTSAACGLPIALAAAMGYVLNATPPQSLLPPGHVGYVHLPLALLLGASSVLFAPMGARLAHRLPGDHLKKAFAVLLVMVAAQLIWRGIKPG
ncbi:MAG: sulfite exporter TauE/SafE family protein [Ahniella sp.]|nr:sulfite exporter TauE/SafE family protein [Ahniella sp.]